MADKKYYRLSRWCRYFRKESVIAFFHTISLALIFLPESIGDKIIQSNFSDFNENNQKIIEEFEKEKLLVNPQYDEMQELVDIQEKLRNDRPLEIMYLLLTDYCNLKCRYCFEETSALLSKPAQPVSMNTNTACRSIEVFARLTTKYGRKEKRRIIHLYGGEPLLNPKVARASVEKINELKKTGFMPKECEIAIVTNGVLLDENIIKFFSEHNVTVGISIDGPSHINGIHRISKEKADVFPVIKHNYELLRKYKVKTGISATLTPEVVKNFNEVLDFFINNIGIQDGISFNILHYNPAISLDSSYFEKAADCLIRAFERFRKLGIYEERIMRKAKSFINRETMFSDCGAIGNQIVVAPDGLVGVCQDFVKPRTYFDYSIFDNDFEQKVFNLFERWKIRSPLFMKECFDCEALGICGGGCSASAELKTGSIWNIDDRICPHSKKTLEWLIWDTFSQSFDA